MLTLAEGGYEWVPPSDYRVAEVRLLHDVETVGKTRADRSRAADNLLIRGDALNGLTSLIELPEFAREHVGKVKLAYLDPPFNTQQAFPDYDDALEHSVWLTMMRDRLIQLKILLSPECSVWVKPASRGCHRDMPPPRPPAYGASSSVYSAKRSCSSGPLNPWDGPAYMSCASFVTL